MNLFAQRLQLDGAAPLVTYYDDSTGERVELSATTFDNWVAKTANLMRDELMVEDGDVVQVDLPLHWQALVWVQAAWTAGAVVELGSHVGGATPAVTVSTPDRMAQALGDERVALSLRPLGLPCKDALPAGVHDYATSVPGHGDHFQASSTAIEGPALVIGDAITSHVALLAVADLVGLTQGQRILRVGALATLDDVVQGWVAPIRAQGSVVVVNGAADHERLARIVADERISAP